MRDKLSAGRDPEAEEAVRQMWLANGVVRADEFPPCCPSRWGEYVYDFAQWHLSNLDAAAS